MKKVTDFMGTFINAEEPMILIAYENKITRNIVIPILALGSLANIIFTYFLNDNRGWSDIQNTIVLFSIAMIFLVVDHFVKDQVKKSNFFGLLQVVIFMYVTKQYYFILGPSIWSIAFIALLMSMFKYKANMMIIMSIITLIMNLYIATSNMTYVTGNRYYITQFIACLVAIVIVGLVRQLSTKRFERIVKQVDMIKDTKDALALSHRALEEKIEEHILTEKALRASELSFKVIFEGSSDPILILKEDKFVECNQVTLEALGYETQEDILGKHPWELSPQFQPDGQSSETKAISILSHSHRTKNTKFEWWHQRKDGTIFPVEIMLTPMVRNNEKVIHIIWRDIKERKKLENELTYLSYHDQLTGLYNRRFFEEELKRLDTPRSLPLTIVMADVNGLKLTNDRVGHAAGDQLLLKVSELLKKELRSEDIVARLGGDEFVILLPQTSEEEGSNLIQRMVKSMDEESKSATEIKVSFGHETKTTPTQDIHEILKMADDKMYHNKALFKTN